jgi:glycosyltransferase involved in cell wall biosynthesis
VSRPLKILLCAYACEPNKGSEPEVGWGTATSLANNDPENKYYVITRKNNKEKIEKQVAPKNLKFIFFELSPLILKIKKAGNFTRIYYYLWMYGAVKFLKKSNREFNIIHHITFVNDWLPSLFIRLKTENNKFIWGPIGSHSKVPNKFLYSRKDKFIEFFRMLLQKGFRNFDPNFKKCIVQSDLIIGINKQVGEKFNVSEEKFLTIPAIAQTSSQESSTITHVDGAFKILSVGRLIHIKNFRLTLKVFSLFFHALSDREKKLTDLTIIGSGSQKKELIRLSHKLNISNKVKFVNYIPQIELMELYKKSITFLFPTLESAGFVILEAMNKELPVIALDYGGPGQFIKQNKNYQLVDPNLPIDKIEERMSLLLMNLFKDKNLRLNIGRCNKQIVLEDFTWDKKVNNFLNIYNDLLTQRDTND